MPWRAELMFFSILHLYINRNCVIIGEEAYMTNIFLRAKEKSKLSYRELANRFGCSSVHMVHLVHDPGRAKDPDVLLNLASIHLADQ